MGWQSSNILPILRECKANPPNTILREFKNNAKEGPYPQPRRRRLPHVATTLKTPSAASGLALRCCAVLVVLLQVSVGVVGAPSSLAVAFRGPRTSLCRALWPLRGPRRGLSPGAALRSALALCVALRGGLRRGAPLRLLPPVASPPARGVTLSLATAAACTWRTLPFIFGHGWFIGSLYRCSMN